MTNLTHISTKLAAVLLLQRGQVSIPDIRALPFVENDETVSTIIECLGHTYQIERSQYRETPNDRWEDVLRLRTPLSEQNA